MTPDAASHDVTPAGRAALIKRVALVQGFDLVGLSPPDASRRADHYRDWIAAGRHGEMSYLARNVEERLNPALRFPWLKTVIALAVSYHHEPVSTDAAEPAEVEGTGKIARYAYGRDYHKVLKKMLERLEKQLHAALGEFQSAAYVDTGPILERDFAARAGLGWIGKHTLLIHPRHGSWFFLAVLLTDLEAEHDAPMADHCGTCTRCIEACPTDAITPYSVDGSRCISYLTLEHRAAIAEEFHPAMREANYLAGCDICQDVCPHNRRPLATGVADFQGGPRGFSLPVVAGWDERGWDEATRGKAYRRVKLGMFQRNAGILGAGG